MPGYDVVLRSRRVVLPGGERPAAVAVSGGRIAAVAGYHELPGEDLGDLALLPGLVDPHVHVNEPGRTQWEGFATTTLAAAAGGTTSIVDMPLNSVPPTVDVAALECKRRAATGRSYVDVGFWGGAVPGNLDALAPMHHAGVFGFKCFLAPSGVEEFAHLDRAGLAAAMRTIRAFDGLLLVHAEDPGQLRPAPASRRYRDFLSSRPPAAELAAVDAVLDSARRTGARVHVLHLSTAQALPAIAAARAGGVRVTVETCPHYLTLAAEDVPDGATEYKCCPPIREAANRDGLWQALADGALDCVASDHSPCPPALKQLDSGDFAAAWGGIASLQLRLPLVWTAARHRGRRLADVVGWLAQRPAEIAGLVGKGRIAVGSDADLVAFAPEEEFVVDPARLRHRHPLTPYAGRRLTGVVHTTWLRGEPVFAAREPACGAGQPACGAGEPVESAPRGRLLSRSAG
jgi:allantoinase